MNHVRRLIHRSMLAVLLAMTFMQPALSHADAEPADVYILSGQSNMQGIGKLAEAPAAIRAAQPEVWLWYGRQFEKLEPGKTKTSTRAGEFGPELGFVQVIAQMRPKARTYVIKFDRSGQPLHEGWDGGKWVDGAAPGRATFYPGLNKDDRNIGKHYLDLVASSKAALGALRKEKVEFRVRGFVWMQGEADAKHEKSARDYATRLALLKRRLEEDVIGHPVPMVFGQVLPFTPAMERFTHRKEIREAMARADWRSGHADAIPHVWMVATDGFPVLADTVHYDAAGQALLGQAMGLSMLAAMEHERLHPPAVQPGAPEPAAP